MKEGGKEGRREGGREGGREGRREGGKEGRREGGKEGRREEGRSARARVVLCGAAVTFSPCVCFWCAGGRCGSRTAESDSAHAVPKGRLPSALSRTKTPRLCVATQSRSVKKRLCPQMAAPCSQPVHSTAWYPPRTSLSEVHIRHHDVHM